MDLIQRIFHIDVLETTKKIIKPSFALHKGQNNGSYGTLFHFFIKSEFSKLLNLSTYKKLYISKDNKAFLEFEECFIEIANLTPNVEKEISLGGTTMIFFKAQNGQKEFFGSLST